MRPDFTSETSGKAAKWLAGKSANALHLVDPWDFSRDFRIGFRTADALLNRERVKRRAIKLSSLTPGQRRDMVDPSELDLAALAEGPIMDPAQLYLPAGKLSMAETLERERRGILPVDQDASR